MVQTTEIEESIKRILIRELEVDPEAMSELTTSTPLLGRGIGLDSMETLTLVTAIEKEFDIQVEDEELTADRFQTVGTLAGFVLGKLQEGSQ